MWSGFNLLASRRFWDALPPDVQDIILRSAKKNVHRQRVHTDALNRGLETTLAERGMTITRPGRSSFRERLVDSGFYVRWKEILGHTAWNLLEQSVGKLG